jgi:hypothetical protein
MASFWQYKHWGLVGSYKERLMLILIDKFSVLILATVAFVAVTSLAAQTAAQSLGDLGHMANEGMRQIANSVSLSTLKLSDFLDGKQVIYTGI